MAQLRIFEEDLRKLINSFGLESESNTPDFILAKYMLDCLNTFNAATKERDKWYQFKPFDNFPDSAIKIKL